jgi:hypothetical protein
MTKTIIGLVGFQGSGKGTVGEYLEESHGFSTDSFANPLKDIVAAAFSWPRYMLEGDTTESREWREQVDEFWSEKLGIPEFTPRYALRYIGTEMFREVLSQSFWVHCLERRIQENPSEHIVITDCRFPDEMNLITRLGGSVIRVQKGPEPVWWNLAIHANSGGESSKQKLEEYGIHPSEYRWIGHPVDHVITNDGTKQELWDKVDQILLNQ